MADEAAQHVNEGRVVTKEFLQSKTKAYLVEVVMKTTNGQLALRQEEAPQQAARLQRLDPQATFQSLACGVALMQAADNMVIQKGASIGINMILCHGKFSLQEVPALVTKFLKDDVTTELIFHKYRFAHEGCPPGRELFVQSDYVALLRVFLVWKLVTSAGYEQAANAGEAKFVNSDMVLLSFARKVADMATGLEDVDISVGKFAEYIKAKALIEAKNAKAAASTPSRGAGHVRPREYDAPRPSTICFHCGLQGHTTKSCISTRPRVHFYQLNQILEKAGMQPLDAAKYEITKKRHF